MEQTEAFLIRDELKDYLSGIESCSICGGTRFRVVLDPREVLVDLSTDEILESEYHLGIMTAQCLQCNEPY